MTAGEPRRGGKRAAILAELRDAAASAPPGTPLPESITSIAARHGVNYGTAYRAAKELEAEGVIEIRHGAGLRAGGRQPILRHGSRRLAREQWASGQDIQAADAAGRSRRTDHVRVGHEDTPPAFAAVIGEGRATFRRRRYSMDDQPVMLAESWLPAAVTAGTAIEQENTGPGGTYARLAEIGQEPVHFTETVVARMPQEREARDLELPRGRPVFEITRYAHTAESRVIEVNQMVLDAGAYLLRYEVDA